MAYDVNFINQKAIATITLDSVDLGGTFGPFSHTISSVRSEIRIQQSTFPVKKVKTEATAQSEFTLAQISGTIMPVVFDMASGNYSSPTLSINANERGEVAFVATGADASMGTATHPVITAPQSVVEGDTTLVLDSENPSQIGPVTVSHLADSNGHVELIVQTAD